MSNKKAKIIVILGTTASGKTTLGVKLAVLFSGEIVSADSRQVYRGMDIGTGKDLKEYAVNTNIDGKINDTKIVNIPYHMIDIADPEDDFSLADYQKQAYVSIDNIIKRGKLPIVVGGSGLYLQAIVDDYQLPGLKPDKKMRAQLESFDVNELLQKLQALNPGFAEKLNNSDRNNKRRLIRYVEIMESQKNNRAELVNRHLNSIRSQSGLYETLLIGLTWPREVLAERIHKRLIDRLKNEDMLGEVAGLHDKEGIEWKKLEAFGLEYKYLSLYLQEKIDYDQMIEQLDVAVKRFAKRQMTWFRRWEKQGAKINWINNWEEAESLVKGFWLVE